MNYVCIEDNKIIGIFNYQPGVPDSVTVVEITDDEAKQIHENTHFLDTDNIVKPRPQADLDAEAANKELELENAEKREFLNSTDWKVMRHIRQTALGIPTTLTEAEYVALENERQIAANSIINP
jgi:hypothetical protein